MLAEFSRINEDTSNHGLPDQIKQMMSGIQHTQVLLPLTNQANPSQENKQLNKQQQRGQKHYTRSLGKKPRIK